MKKRMIADIHSSGMPKAFFFTFAPMKWIIGLLFAITLFSSCDNELVVADNWKDIPIVWGLLNKSDTAHYIRVEKAFLDPNTNALEIARIPDSLYYENAAVSLRRVNSGQTFPLTRVNGDLEGYPREAGIFAESPNYLFKIKANVINLVTGEEYELIVDRGDGKEPVTARTIVLPMPVLRTPPPGSLIAFKRGSLFHFDWNDMPAAGIFDLKLRFHYSERSPETGNILVPKSVEWTVARGLVESEYSMNGIDFYTNLRTYIEENIQATRFFESIDIILWAGGKELEDYIKLTNANTGITSTQDIPVFTNLSEGLGVFSSRNVSINTGFQLTNASLDSLRNSSITDPLNFQ